MASVNVRQLDDEVVQSFKPRTAANHCSLEGEARHILAAAAEDDPEAKRKSFQELTSRLRRQGPCSDILGNTHPGRPRERASDRLTCFAVDAIEAQVEGTLTGVEVQSEKCCVGLPDSVSLSR